MKTIYTLFAVFAIFVSVMNTANAQCTPDATNMQDGFSPDFATFTCVERNVFYNETLQFRIPTTLVLSGNSLQVNYVRFESINNLPCGIGWVTDRPSRQYNGGENGCFQLTGFTSDASGTYEMQINIAASVVGFPGEQPTNTSLINFPYYLRVRNTGAACANIDTTNTLNSTCSNLSYNNLVSNVPLTADAGSDTSICAGQNVTIGGSSTAIGGTGPFDYSWTPTATLGNPTAPNPVANPTATTTYTVTIEDYFGVTVSDNVLVTVNSSPVASVSNDTTICVGGTAQLTATGGGNYSWSPTTGLSDPTSANPTASPTANTTYTVTVSNAGCTDSEAVTVTVDACPGITETTAKSLNFNIYPNPANGTYNIALAGSTGDVDVTIYNTFGQSVYSTLHTAKPGKNTITLSAEKLAAGVYFIQIATAEGKGMRKLIIE